MRRNPGYLPHDAAGRRVRVILANGKEGRSDPAGPPGWAADGKGGCCWARRGFDFDIREYEVIR